MKKLFVIFPVLVVLFVVPFSFASHRGRFIQGRKIYKNKLGKCAMWWRRLGDIKKSSGKRLSKNTELFQELGRMSEKQIKKWLVNPTETHPRVNCRPGPFHRGVEVTNLIHYMKRMANSPPVKRKKRVRAVFKRTKIRLLKTMKIRQQRLKTLDQIRKWLPQYDKKKTIKKSLRKRNHKLNRR
jgi:hypothetical protein